jgi:hypothetical protein
MALGNNSGKGTARHKGQIKQSIKERRDANGFIAILSTARQGTSACALSIGSNEYYHDGSGTFPAANDKVYSRKRKSTRYILEDGHYKMHNASDTRTTKNIEISSGEVSRVTACP